MPPSRVRIGRTVSMICIACPSLAGDHHVAVVADPAEDIPGANAKVAPPMDRSDEGTGDDIETLEPMWHPMGVDHGLDLFTPSCRDGDD